MNISIRVLSIDDLETVDNIVTSAFGFTDSRAVEIRRYLALKPNRWFLATYRNQPAGVVGSTNYGIFTYLGMMTVRKELQRKGIGRSLLQHMLNWTETMGISYLRLDATDAGFLLYRQFGFEVFDQALMFRLADYSPNSNFPQQVRLLKVEDVETLVAFDTPIFGANRSGLFHVMLKNFPDRAFALYDATGSMAGYLFSQTQRLGPWAACSAQAAEILLKAALTLTYRDVPLVIIPEINKAAPDLLGRYGFRHEFTNRHMQRGLSAIPGRRKAIYGQTSFAIG
jgi:GNAT superfamily N-acetyltransferase